MSNKPEPAPSQSSDHPETDAAMFMVHDIDRMAVDIDFARSLERRLRAAERELGECRRDAERCKKIAGMIRTSTWQSAKLRDSAAKLVEIILKVEKDNDTLQDAALNAQKGREGPTGEQHG